MLPMKDGSFVIGKFIEDRNDIKTGRTYVLLTINYGMVYKRVYNKIQENNTLKLVSDNPTYEPYMISIDEVMEIWEFNWYYL